ncbi:hypothetical protein BKK49_05395 [Rodentibacter rarus]|nr:hypothetical protein BKK49_05395 [Rodentibacter rarus]
MLGISKSTLYRWNNLNDQDDYGNITRHISTLIQNSDLKTKFSSYPHMGIRKIVEDSDIPKNFPRPFKIGRAYKWREDEILEWLNTMRV